MPLEIEATYEDGVLKLDKPLPFSEHARVLVSVIPKSSRIRDSDGLIGWTGDPEILRKIANDDEFDVVESP